MHGLLAAVMDLGRDLELPQVLRSIVEAAIGLTDAEYGALGVIGDDAQLSRFLPVGMAEDLAARIGPAPCGHGILGELIHNPAPLRLDDLTRHPSSFGFPAHHPPMRTFLGAPIRVRDQVFGNIYLTEKRGGGAFDADDEAVLTTLSAAAGVAIDNARLYRDSRRRERRLEALGEITRALLAGHEPDDVLRLIARRAMEVADADLASVLLPSGPNGDLTVQVAHGDTADAVRGAVLPATGSLAGLAARTRGTVVTTDVRTDPRALPLGGAAGTGHGPVVAVPLPVDDAVCGALRLSRKAGRQGFDAAETELLSGFADQAAIALELARRRAESEELTVLHDRDRIARDLHDVAIQRLFATGMTLQSATRTIDDAPAAERVTRAVDDLDATIQIIRSTILQLRTADDDRGGPALRRRLAETVQLAAQHLGFTPSLRITGPVDSTVPEALAEQVLAVAGEALSNTARHARASRAEVVLAVPDTADRIVLTVTDDGIGLGSARPTGGLLNMSSRAEQCRGSVRLDAPGERGTRITWSAPLSSE
ncbi:MULTISPECIES: GAF domain-containing protein [unclassified Streptomyces]|uniref:sensor histidine kinase n=1 Tax=unclassified Streptomyces TaxID=2593676 RepID=UPI0016610C97|nr:MULTISPECIES: GAF domain-containing protein [unclassified Streptomyces]MBD0710433.1 histidine kinase [Streptomyces sp. CBMA291]MBD0712768.1 histidine kinase [Streptomyces sp. CBMA370]